ncbi:RNA polymerase sigma-54 factor [Catenibacillus scindens]|uniref:RNA polymerase sigma-54 factor n=1 Tax=Catenibacillus scindens TaxID=673271 RepID=A0A7W8H7C9_9FIRM|nr:RNA polymerase factor sigma-54 [Catenibacillus scindens]MBB5263256.1 RNA polymerase sigma-54 factor [Catenibacillus scindens]
MELKMEMSQNIVLSQKMIQSTEILQMSALELEKYIKDLAMENPVVDLEERTNEPVPGDELTRKLEWLDSSDEQNRVYYSSDYNEDEKNRWNFSVDEGEDLGDYLMSQLIGANYSRNDMELLNYMVQCLDSRGYFTEEISQVARSFSVDEDKVLSLLFVIQGLEPAGVGARDLKECLLLQMDRLGIQDHITRAIVTDYLELLGKNQLHVIARKMKASLDEVSTAARMIKTLNPKPGSGFSSREHLKYITPDVVVVRLGGYYEILLNEYMYPKMSINSYYLKLLKCGDSQETKDYISEKVSQAHWIMNCISQRNRTLINVTKAIIDVQNLFFAMGPGNLKPMKLADIAERLDIHESTVSRAVRDKYMQCSWGVYPLNYFFSKGIAAGVQKTEVTPQDVKRCIRQVIQKENKKKPLSDRLIALALEDLGVHISRRTVAKYREEEGIKDASGRKVFD